MDQEQTALPSAERIQTLTAEAACLKTEVANLKKTVSTLTIREQELKIREIELKARASVLEDIVESLMEKMISRIS
jgi:hypothetical protein